MIIRLRKNIESKKRDRLLASVQQLGFKTTAVRTQESDYLVCVGQAEPDIRSIGTLEGVDDVFYVSDQNKLVSRQWKIQDTEIDLGDGVKIGNGNFAIMAGPCSVESEEQVERTVEFLVKQEVKIMRGGVFKPRSSPYAFRGAGLEGLKYFHRRCRAAGIKIVTEVMQESQIESMYDYVDIFQVGARNSQNFNLLDALGSSAKPVLLKRGMSGTIEELLSSAEYIFSGGNEHILLCERGIRTYEKEYRNTLDLNAVPLLRRKSHLPVIVDPSHGIGIRRHVGPMALAAVMAGADGVMLEIHQVPETAFSDGQQTLNFDEAEKLFGQIRATRQLKQSFEIN